MSFIVWTLNRQFSRIFRLIWFKEEFLLFRARTCLSSRSCCQPSPVNWRAIRSRTPCCTPRTPWIGFVLYVILSKEVIIFIFCTVLLWLPLGYHEQCHLVTNDIVLWIKCKFFSRFFTSTVSKLTWRHRTRGWRQQRGQEICRPICTSCWTRIDSTLLTELVTWY